MDGINKLAVPQAVLDKLGELNALVDAHPLYIPVPEAAALMGMEPASLRASIDSGNCPFALGWQKDIKNCSCPLSGRRGCGSNWR